MRTRRSDSISINEERKIKTFDGIEKDLWDLLNVVDIPSPDVCEIIILSSGLDERFLCRVRNPMLLAVLAVRLPDLMDFLSVYKYDPGQSNPISINKKRKSMIKTFDGIEKDSCDFVNEMGDGWAAHSFKMLISFSRMGSGQMSGSISLPDPLMLAVLAVRLPSLKAYLSKIKAPGPCQSNSISINKKRKIRTFDGATKEEDFRLDELCTWDDDDCYVEGSERPKELPSGGQLLVEGYISASYLAVDRKTKRKWNGGCVPSAMWDLVNLTNLSTKCKRVLLAFNHNILRRLQPFLTKHSSEYLAILVGWEAQSYLFLRRLADSLPDLTFIAVTDLDHHHLDLLAFLISPPCELREHYNWDLFKECEESGVSSDSSLNIKWLGLRPSDAARYTDCFKARAFKQCQTDFTTVTQKLLANPKFLERKMWVDEVNVLSKRPLYLPFEFLSPKLESRQKFIEDQYLDKKLLQEDWI